MTKNYCVLVSFQSESTRYWTTVRADGNRSPLQLTFNPALNFIIDKQYHKSQQYFRMTLLYLTASIWQRAGVCWFHLLILWMYLVGYKAVISCFKKSKHKISFSYSKWFHLNSSCRLHKWGEKIKHIQYFDQTQFCRTYNGQT